MMRGQIHLLLWVLLLPILSSGLSSPSIQASSSIQSSEFIIFEVCPDFKSEFVVLKNISPHDANLTGWSLTDGEGVVEFNQTLMLAPDERLIVTGCSSMVAPIYPGVRSIEYPSNASLRGRFTLANEGDDLWLKDRGGKTVDGLVYGTAASGSIWSGPPLKRIPQGDVAQRQVHLLNATSAADWVVVSAGRSSLPSEEFEAVVEPFSCPENALPRVIREIILAAHSIQVAVYELSSPQIVAALAERSRSGVAVHILIEGQPVSGISNASIAAAQILSDEGCEVRMLKTGDGFRRYDFLHCKYLVVDDRRTVVISENLGRGLTANRGWGVAVDDQSLAKYMLGLFEEDWRNTSFDISSIERLEDHRSDFRPDASVPPLGEICPYLAKVRTVVSPDNSFEELLKLVSSAQRRIDIQQLECDLKWLQSPSLMEEVLAAAKRGVEVRLLFDSTWSTEAQEMVSSLNTLAADQSLDLVARCISPYHEFEIMHNKGMIVDDSCLISSINWVDTALYNNREVGLIVQSKEISSFFFNFFLRDWEVDPDPPLIQIEDHVEAQEGRGLLLNASGCYDRSGIISYEWDLGGDGVVDWTGEYCLIELPRGNHTILLTITDTFNNTASAALTVEVVPLDEKEGKEGLIPVVIMTSGAIFIFSSVWKSIKAKK